MITGDWAGVTAYLGNQIKTMLQQHGVVYSTCPQPAQTLTIKDYVIHLPKVSSIVSYFLLVRICLFVCFFDDVYRHFQQYFSYIVAVSFIGGGNRRTRRKPPTCRKSLKNFIT
jgi:hypothetical protein